MTPHGMSVMAEQRTTAGAVLNFTNLNATVAALRSAPETTPGSVICGPSYAMVVSSLLCDYPVQISA
jgi:hypothetical protein